MVTTKAARNIPTVSDREFCVEINGEIPVPSRLSNISRD